MSSITFLNPTMQSHIIVYCMIHNFTESFLKITFYCISVRESINAAHFLGSPSALAQSLSQFWFECQV